MAVQSNRELIQVSLRCSLTRKKLSGECEFWLGGCQTLVCTERVASAVWQFDTGGLSSLVGSHIFPGTWDQVVVFLLPNTDVPLGRFTDLREHIVRDEQGYNWLHLDVIIKQR